ncbi:uncharacterized protein CXorf49-like isoform X2 [Eptesicus fuscus]|uniref:uncharacterized protein CXorf49-like isoform X2 n=1 Tax=Eptesicus fuscus TaxID=29078 RepID=UPI002403C16D|nr:uncharacterized protein CXorf49-like isoform X2 [Eptesicus fuscus]
MNSPFNDEDSTLEDILNQTEPSSPNPPPPDPEPSDVSSDEFPEAQLMRVSIFFKGGSQVKPSGFKGSRKTSRKRVLGGPGALLSSIRRTSPAIIQRQSARELVLSSPNKLSAKKMPTIVSGKRPDRPSLLLRSTPRKKEPQEKKSRVGCVSKIVLGRKSQACISGGPPAPATFPPISGPPPPLFGIIKNYPVAPLGSKQPKHNSRKKSAVSRPRESELVAQEDTNVNKEAAPMGQISTNRRGPRPRLSVHFGDCIGGEPKIKTFPVPGHVQLLAIAQEGVKSRVTPPSGNQGPLLHLPPQEEKPPPPGAQDCPQCPVLQREIDELKSQLATMQSLINKFQRF